MKRSTDELKDIASSLLVEECLRAFSQNPDTHESLALIDAVLTEVHQRGQASRTPASSSVDRPSDRDPNKELHVFFDGYDKIVLRHENTNDATKRSDLVFTKNTASRVSSPYTYRALVNLMVAMERDNSNAEFVPPPKDPDTVRINALQHWIEHGFVTGGFDHQGGFYLRTATTEGDIKERHHTSDIRHAIDLLMKDHAMDFGWEPEPYTEDGPAHFSNQEEEVNTINNLFALMKSVGGYIKDSRAVHSAVTLWDPTQVTTAFDYLVYRKVKNREDVGVVPVAEPAALAQLAEDPINRPFLCPITGITIVPSNYYLLHEFGDPYRADGFPTLGDALVAHKLDNPSSDYIPAEAKLSSCKTGFLNVDTEVCVFKGSDIRDYLAQNHE